MSKPTFYRHRSELLPLGIDIALPNEQVECEIIPLFRKVTGRPVGIPDWAYQQGLVYQSRVGG
ncbi:phage/plasmid replication domain-containing protein [Kineobactrum salinum]